VIRVADGPLLVSALVYSLDVKPVQSALQTVDAFRTLG
jgi:hypothetical protein